MTVRIGLKQNYTNNEAGNTWDDSMTSLKEGTRQIWASKSPNTGHDVGAALTHSWQTKSADFIIKIFRWQTSIKSVWHVHTYWNIPEMLNTACVVRPPPRHKWYTAAKRICCDDQAEMVIMVKRQYIISLPHQEWAYFLWYNHSDIFYLEGANILKI